MSQVQVSAQTPTPVLQMVILVAVATNGVVDAPLYVFTSLFYGELDPFLRRT